MVRTVVIAVLLICILAYLDNDNNANLITDLLGFLFLFVIVTYGIIPTLAPGGTESKKYEVVQFQHNIITDENWAKLANGEKVKIEYTSTGLYDIMFVYKNIEYTFYGGELRATYSKYPNYHVKKEINKK